MKKLLLVFAVLLNSYCVNAMTLSFNIEAKGLSAYKLFLYVKKQIQGKYSESTNGTICEADSTALKLVDKQINLLDEIIDDFNKGYLLFVKNRFLSVCSHIKSVEIIEPRHIRAFLGKLERFNKFLQKYYIEMYSSMSAEEIQLCKKINEFNIIFAEIIDRDDYLDITLADNIVDWLVFRPYEFVADYPLTVAATCTAAAVPIAILCAQARAKKPEPEFQDFSNSSSSTPLGMEAFGSLTVQPEINIPDTYEQNKQEALALCRDIPEGFIKREASLEPQSGRRCGKHALRNAYGLAGTGADADKERVVEIPSFVEAVDRNGKKYYEQKAIGIKMRGVGIQGVGDDDEWGRYVMVKILDSYDPNGAMVRKARAGWRAYYLRKHHYADYLLKRGRDYNSILNDMTDEEVQFIIEYEESKGHGIKVFNVSLYDLPSFLIRREFVDGQIFKEWEVQKILENGCLKFVMNTGGDHFIEVEIHSNPDSIVYKDSVSPSADESGGTFAKSETMRLIYNVFFPEAAPTE